MNNLTNLNPPAQLMAIEGATVAAGFTMASDPLTGALLRTLAASKPVGVLLELGTGTGVGTAWLLAGMDAGATLTTVDNNADMQAIARRHLGHDPRLVFCLQEGSAFIETMGDQGAQFDLIFADTWPGKYNHLDETFRLIKPGGFYIVDDLLPQPTWPPGHAQHVTALLATLERRTDLHLTQLNWATGLLIGTKIA
ncbi:MAG: class I SAM-dependent methyltransferase [Chloroflexota bacterium]|nr:class I SAM-dependent methyltransferase [Chloroflexota bacterium]